MSDTSIIPIFFTDAVHMAFKSEEAGRPIYEDREHIRILIAGDQRSEVVREVTDADRERFAEAYRKFKAGLKDAEQHTGTPLSQWAQMSTANVRMFNSINIFSVEQVAAMSDTAVGNFGMGGLEWRAKARAFLETAANSAEAEKYAAENERMRAEINDLRAQIKDLGAHIEKRGPGRPPKSEAA